MCFVMCNIYFVDLFFFSFFLLFQPQTMTVILRLMKNLIITTPIQSCVVLISFQNWSKSCPLFLLFFSPFLLISDINATVMIAK